MGDHPMGEHDQQVRLYGECVTCATRPATPPPAQDTPAAPLPPRSFGGSTYQPSADAERLGSQLAAVRGLMGDGRWRTLDEIWWGGGGTPGECQRPPPRPA